jgi:hypothetical protein
MFGLFLCKYPTGLFAGNLNTDEHLCIFPIAKGRKVWGCKFLFVVDANLLDNETLYAVIENNTFKIVPEPTFDCVRLAKNTFFYPTIV